MLILETKDNARGFAPGQAVEGRVGWQEDHAPKNAVLRLFWYTEGKGTQDVGVAAELELPGHLPAHEEPFAFTLPEAPYSFSGKLIALRWALELVLHGGKNVTRLELLVSPWVKEAELGAVEDSGKKKWGFSAG